MPRALGNFEVAVPGMSLPTISEDNMKLMTLSGEASDRLMDVEEKLAHLAMMDNTDEQ